jgi:hypothetical protein
VRTRNATPARGTADSPQSRPIGHGEQTSDLRLIGTAFA